MKAFYRKTIVIFLFLAVMFTIVGTAAAEDVHNRKPLDYVQDDGITQSGVYDSGAHYDSSTRGPVIHVHDFQNYEQ